METLPEKPCQHCGKNFVPQRSSKKYCSDNCRQMSYFKRNGFVQVNNEEENKIEKFTSENNHASSNEKKEVKVILFPNENKTE